MTYALVTLVGYLIGSLNLSIIVGKWKRGIDIRDVNSTNPGASNVTLTLGFKWGVVVFFFDLLKGFVPVFVTRLLFPDQDIYWFLAGFGALMGHAFPLYYQFKGGKGTSTYLGVVLGAFPLFGVILFVVLVLTTVVSDYIVVGTLFLILPPPIYMMIVGKYHWSSIALLSIFAGINLYKHKNNFIHLVQGTEAKVLASIKKKT
jgi:glycerol-3-phosphate acyltransferase PlsY